jgi:sulfide:quinone oxidoreductase
MGRPRRQVLVVGGGVGALEAALALRAQAYDCVDVEMLAPDPYFTYRPLSVGEPFGHEPPWRFELGTIAADRRFRVRRGALARVEPDEHRIVTTDGEAIGYDALVLAIGAVPRVAVPGALTFTGADIGPRLAEALRGDNDAPRRRIAFVVPPHTPWSLAIYELALLTASWAQDEGLALDLTVVTPERAPLEILGPVASREIAELLAERGVAVFTQTVAEQFQHSCLSLAPLGSMAAAVAVALPRFDGPAVSGLSADELGFAPVDDFCRVRGVDDVYAIGDMTDRPIRQGGLAAQQADVAAAAIAAWAGAPVDAEPYRPVLRALMFTGGRHRYFRYPRDAEDSRPEPAPGSPALWWPAHKIAARHLASYLAVHRHDSVAARAGQDSA